MLVVAKQKTKKSLKPIKKRQASYFITLPTVADFK